MLDKDIDMWRAGVKPVTVRSTEPQRLEPVGQCIYTLKSNNVLLHIFGVQRVNCARKHAGWGGGGGVGCVHSVGSLITLLRVLSFFHIFQISLHRKHVSARVCRLPT